MLSSLLALRRCADALLPPVQQDIFPALQHLHRFPEDETTVQSLADVALHMGFADQGHLQRSFKAHHALTPDNFARTAHTAARAGRSFAARQ
nr:hypothetical protein [Comamonas testosteroni]